MKDKNNNTKKADKIIKKDYSFMDTIGTYFDAELGEMSNVEAEIKAMKHKEHMKEKKEKKEKR